MMTQNPSAHFWQQAIEDAERQLKDAKTRVRQLKATLSTLKENAERGTPWPGTVIKNKKLKGN